jgi:formiminotetrahydrofolate cyclodeaminase
VDSDHGQGELHRHLIDLPIRQVLDDVANPAVNAGGGVVAAVTLAGAAASAELVLRLASRRKSLADRREEVVALLSAVEDHRSFFDGAADRDIAAFTALVDAQRDAKRMRETDPMHSEILLQNAYVRAAEVPLQLSREALAFIMVVEQGLQFASRFTISDLGAAAVLARGAIDAAILTVDANLAYVEDGRAESFRGELGRLKVETTEIAERVLTMATNVITNHKAGGAA